MDLDFNAFSRFTKVFKSDEIIFSEHEPGETFYVIQSGKVKLVRNDGEFERVLAVIQTPEMFGEMAILEGSPRSASAIAVDEVKVLKKLPTGRGSAPRKQRKFFIPLPCRTG